MVSNEYVITYICPECNDTTAHSSYGAKSEVFRTLSYMVKDLSCVACAKTNKNVMMDILKVRCKISKPKDVYRVSWRCRDCSSVWESTVSLAPGQSSTIISTELKPKCVNPRCFSRVHDIDSDNIHLFHIKMI